MSRSYLLRRPKEDDDDDEVYGSTPKEIVRAKPLEPRVARNLGPAYAKGKDFVKASQKSQQEFYGSQSVLLGGTNSSTSKCREEEEGEEQKCSFREMTHDERNKLNASIIKYELRGDTERVNRLKRKLNEGVIEIKLGDAAAAAAGCSQEFSEGSQKSVILLEMDRRTGLTKPSESLREKDQEDDDDDSLDNVLGLTKKRRLVKKGNNDARKQDLIREHKHVERTLDSCSKCIESRLLEKHAVVATGDNIYLAVVNWDGLSPDHCYIAPMAHFASALHLDEDVWEEMHVWMQKLVEMWRRADDGGLDCIFVESARNVLEQRHMTMECIPIPREEGDMAPIYFKKAILESETEWSANAKLIDLSKNSRKSQGVRGLIPKGFSYFAVNFGLQPGYAHVIEQERRFPENFAQEIVGGMLDLHHRHWKNPKRQTFDEVKQKRDRLVEKWSLLTTTEEKEEGEEERQKEEEGDSKEEEE